MSAGLVAGPAATERLRAPAAHTLVLSVSALSSDYRKSIERHIGSTPEYLQLANLRRMPLPRLAAFLRSLTPARLYVPIEDQDSAVMRPILECVASFTGADRITVLDADLTPHSVHRHRALLTLFGLAAATIDGRRMRWRAEREASALLRADRTPLALISRGEVAYLNANLWFGVKAGGSTGHIAGVANALHRGGWPVRYVAAVGAAMLDPAIQLARLDAPRTFGFPPEVNLYRFNRIGFEQALELLLERRPSFLYQRMSVGNYFGVQLSRALGIPLVLEYNGSEVWAARHWGRAMRYEAVAEAAESVCLRHAHLIVTVSEVLRDELVGRGVSPERVVWYPNCIDGALFDPDRFDAKTRVAVRARYDILAGDLVVTFVGTFGRWHGVDILAETIRDLATHDAEWLNRHRVRFLLVGDGMMMPQVRETLDDVNCAPFVRLAGLVPQHEAAMHLAASDILVSPHVRNPDGTRFFGSPTKLFEYMAMARPIIASDLDQIGTVLRPSIRARDAVPGADAAGGLAVLCEPGDRGDLKRALRLLVERPEVRASLGRRAREEALSKYLWQHHVRAILERLPLAERDTLAT